jgi:hypothetical protein
VYDNFCLTRNWQSGPGSELVPFRIASQLNMVKLSAFYCQIFISSLFVMTLLRNAPVDFDADTSNDAVCNEEVPFWGLIHEKFFSGISLPRTFQTAFCMQIEKVESPLNGEKQTKIPQLICTNSGSRNRMVASCKV